MANIYDMADTWNDINTTFTAIKMTVTDTSSASGSLLLDLQHGVSGSETSKFSVSEDGGVLSASKFNVLSTSYGMEAAGNGYLGFKANNVPYAFAIAQDWFNLNSNATIAFTDGDVKSTRGLILSRKGPANLRFGAADATAPVAQTLSVQSVTGVDNTVGPNFTIEGSQGTGSGGGGSIIFKVAPADTTPGNEGVQNTPTEVFKINPSRWVEFTGSGTSAGNYVAQFRDSTGGLTAWVAASGGFVGTTGSFSTTLTTPLLAFSPTQGTRLQEDAANTLALRYGTNAQTFNIYNTFTNATNFERGFIKWDTDVFTIGMEKGASGGTARVTKILLGGNVNTFVSADNAGSTSRAVLSGQGAIEFATSGIVRVLIGNSNMIPAFDQSIDLGAPSGFGWASLSIKERSADPANPNEGHSVMWQSDGTGSGDDGDIMMKITAGGVTKTATIVDFSAI